MGVVGAQASMDLHDVVKYAFGGHRHSQYDGLLGGGITCSYVTFIPQWAFRSFINVLRD